MSGPAPALPDAFRVVALGTRDLSCPYCGEGGDRPRSRRFMCKACGQSVRPRARADEGDARYLTEADWFLVDALRLGELTPDVVAAAMAGRPPDYLWHKDKAVIFAIEAAIESVAAQLSAHLGRPATSTDLLMGYFQARVGAGSSDLFRCAFDKFRFAAFLYRIGEGARAEAELLEAIYLGGSNGFDPLIAPGWLTLLEKMRGAPPTRAEIEMAARRMGGDASSAKDAWGTLNGRPPPRQRRFDFLAALADDERARIAPSPTR